MEGTIDVRDARFARNAQVTRKTKLAFLAAGRYRGEDELHAGRLPTWDSASPTSRRSARRNRWAGLTSRGSP